MTQKETDLWKFGDGFRPTWVAFGAHLDFDELVSRHSEDYGIIETEKAIMTFRRMEL